MQEGLGGGQVQEIEAAELNLGVEIHPVGTRIIVPPLLAAHSHKQELYPAMIGPGHDLLGVARGPAGARQLLIAARGLFLLSFKVGLD